MMPWMIRKRIFGNLAVRRAVTIDDQMGRLDAKKDHVIYPISYFKRSFL